MAEYPGAFGALSDEMALVGQLVTVLLRLGGFLVVVGGAVLLVAEAVGRVVLLVAETVGRVVLLVAETVGRIVLLVAETIGRIVLLVSQAVLFGTVVVLRHGHFTSFQLMYSYYSKIRTVYSMQ